MAKSIMEPVAVPEQHLLCAFCHKTAQPMLMHMHNCTHWLHVHCFLLQCTAVHHKLHCPTCHLPSVRTIAWPGSFPSDMVKQTIFGNQLAQFKLAKVQDDTQLVFVEVAIADYPLIDRVKIFTVDYGGPRVIVIDAATVQVGSIIEYD